jgi:hypothetical protein
MLDLGFQSYRRDIALRGSTRPLKEAAIGSISRRRGPRRLGAEGGRPQTSRQLADEEPYDVIVADAVVDTRIEAPAAHVVGVDTLAKFGE